MAPRPSPTLAIWASGRWSRRPKPSPRFAGTAQAIQARAELIKQDEQRVIGATVELQNAVALALATEGNAVEPCAISKSGSAGALGKI